MSKLFIYIPSVLLFCILTSCNTGTASNSGGGGNSNYLPAGNYIQQNGTMSAILNGNNTPIYSKELCQSEASYNITINSSGQRCVSGGCTEAALLIKQSICFNSTKNPGTIPNLGTITSYSDTWSDCQYKSNVLTAVRSVVIHGVNGNSFTLLCNGAVTIYK